MGNIFHVWFPLWAPHEVWDDYNSGLLLFSACK